MSNLFKAQGLTKGYPGKSALTGVDFSITPGKVIGFLGPNGSGKTTLMKIMAGILQPQGGQFTGPDGTRGLEARKKISFLPDAMQLPGWMRVHDGFQYYKDMFEDFSQDRALQLMEMLELHPMDRIRTLSKGMQERVFLGMTLSRDASLYLLDEPLGGIDPVGKARIIDAILAMELDQASIIISTHLVRDIERVFDEAYFISQGRIAGHVQCDDLREQKGQTVEQAYLEVFGYA